jgi:hypothetical protein
MFWQTACQSAQHFFLWFDWGSAIVLADHTRFSWANPTANLRSIISDCCARPPAVPGWLLEALRLQGQSVARSCCRDQLLYLLPLLLYLCLHDLHLGCRRLCR